MRFPVRQYLTPHLALLPLLLGVLFLPPATSCASLQATGAKIVACGVPVALDTLGEAWRQIELILSDGGISDLEVPQAVQSIAFYFGEDLTKCVLAQKAAEPDADAGPGDAGPLATPAPTEGPSVRTARPARPARPPDAVSPHAKRRRAKLALEFLQQAPSSTPNTHH